MAHNTADVVRDELQELEEVETAFINVQGDVYVELDDMTNAERAITVGFDHGWTPNGIIDTVKPAFRLKPRHAFEYDL